MMSFKQFKKSGQSAVELSLIATLVVGVSWSGLQLLNSKMAQGTSAFAGQYSGTAVAAGTSSSGSGGSPSSPAPFNPSAPAPSAPILPVNVNPPPPNLPPFATVVGIPAAANPVTTTGLTVQNPPVSPLTTTGSTPTQATPVFVGTTTTGAANPPTNSPSNAQPASGDGCMGCAASMTTDLGW